MIAYPTGDPDWPGNGSLVGGCAEDSKTATLGKAVTGLITGSSSDPKVLDLV